MKFKGSTTFVSPEEVSFLNEVCSSFPKDYPPTLVKEKIIEGFLKWCEGQTPPLQPKPGLSGTWSLIARAVEVVDPNSEESIPLDLDLYDLETVMDVSIYEVSFVKEEASNTNANFALDSAIANVIFPEEVHETWLSEEQEESLKSDIFEDHFRTIAIGNGIIDSIRKHIGQ